MLELLSLSRLDADQADVLQSARESGRSLLRILNDILDRSKIEDGKLELAPQATSIAALVARVLNTYARVASARSVTLEPHIDARLGPAHLVDPLRLSQVLNNFVSNAIKFSHVGGRVELRAERVARHADAEEIRFSVQDKGIGIDPDEQQRLFQRYGQASADTARMYGGTGLGLSICRRLAELMQGRIELDSAPGRGSTISLTLTLPIAAAAVESEPDQSEIDTAAFAPPLVAGVAAADAPLVLVVDDPAILRDFLLDFRAGAATIADELSAACANGEMERVEALAHKLKSSARSVGALALGELCAELEAAGKAGQSTALPRVWLRFTAEMEVVDAALAELTTPRDTPDREVPTCDTV